MRPPAELAALALDVARAAGALVAPAFRSRPRTRVKQHAEIVTEFDLASERAIRERLAELTPEIPIVAEEQGGERGAELTWYCDPIDGTTNFAHGHPFWCVSIGVGRGAHPVAGAVVAPMLGLEWWGAEGTGAFRNGEPCGVSATASLEDALVATGFPSDRSSAPDDNFDAFARVKRRVRGVRRCGSAAIDLCLVADGTYDAYWERKLSIWDVAAGAAICAAAGARLTALDGSKASFDVGHVLVSNGRIHDALLELVG